MNGGKTKIWLRIKVGPLDCIRIDIRVDMMNEDHRPSFYTLHFCLICKKYAQKIAYCYLFLTDESICYIFIIFFQNERVSSQRPAY